MDSTSKEIQFVTPKNKYTIFYYKIPVSFGSPYVCHDLPHLQSLALANMIMHTKTVLKGQNKKRLI